MSKAQSEAKRHGHTPGPWQKMAAKSYSFGIATADEDMLHLMYVDEAPGLGTQAEANARFIAAAPELLEALKSAILYIETYGGEVTENFAAGGCLAHKKAVIAKATGESL